MSNLTSKDAFVDTTLAKMRELIKGPNAWNELLQKVKFPDRALSAGTLATLQDFNLVDQDGKVSDVVAATVEDMFLARVELFDAKYCGSKEGVTPDAETVAVMQSMSRLYQSTPNLWNEFLSKAKDPAQVVERGSAIELRERGLLDGQGNMSEDVRDIVDKVCLAQLNMYPN